VREIYVSCAGDPVHAGDTALMWETPAQRGMVNRYGNKKIVYFLQPPYLFTIDRLFLSIVEMFSRAHVGGRFGRKNRLVDAHFSLY
jgi:hypothetical protein